MKVIRFTKAWPDFWSSDALSKFYGQATKGAWWMPWQKQAMKDVVSCDKLRLAANRHFTRRFPNGETLYGKTV